MGEEDSGAVPAVPCRNRPQLMRGMRLYPLTSITQSMCQLREIDTVAHLPSALSEEWAHLLFEGAIHRRCSLHNINGRANIALYASG